jgi:XRE family transcriptional regulator, regulator of sulfur utilization
LFFLIAFTMDQLTFGNRLRLLRINQELSQENIADLLDMTQSAYSKIERGNRSVTLDFLIRASGVFNLKLSQMIAYCEGSLSLSEIILEMDL